METAIIIFFVMLCIVLIIPVTFSLLLLCAVIFGACSAIIETIAKKVKGRD